MDVMEREIEVQRLREENKAILSTPLLSEGSISPAQVGMFSKRQGRQWINNAQRRMQVESQIKELQLTDEQIASNEAEAQREANESRILQIQRQMQDIQNIGIGKNGKLRPKYQRVCDQLHNELRILHNG